MKRLLALAAASVPFWMPVVSPLLHGADPDPRPGKKVFERRCSGCHSPDINKVGPRLRGVLNRKAGTVAGFPYSDGLRNSGFSWDEKRLDQWIANPDAVVKDNEMEFRVENADERASIIGYLKSLTK